MALWPPFVVTDCKQAEPEDRVPGDHFPGRRMM